MSLRKFAGLAALSLAVFGSSVAMAQDATTDQVYQAMRAGHYAEAQGMMDKVLRDHPNSGEAHYIEAEVLAKQGNIPGARAEFSKAEQLKPGLPFANASSVAELRAQLAQGTVSRPVQNSYVPPPAPVQYAPQRSSGIPWVMIIVLLALVAFVVMVARAFGNRNVVVAQGGGVPYGGGFGGGAPMMGGGYGGGGYPMGGGGIGSGIVGGLATGAALGAGVVAGEELMHHFTDGDRGGNYAPNQGGGGWDQSAPPANSDMGGNDFGVNDSGSSWGDGGGGGDSGGGGGGDWN